MAGSDDKYGVTYSDLIDLFAGRISDEKRVALARAIYDPEHPLSYLARRSTKDRPFIEDWPPQDLHPNVVDLLNDKSLPEHIHDEVRTALASIIDGNRNVADLSNREIADSLLEKCDIDANQQLNFLLFAAAEIENAQKEYAGLLLDRRSEEPDTVSSQLDTTFAASESNPQATVLRHDAILTFRKIDVDQSNIFLLHEYAGRTTKEIAELLETDTPSVSQQLSIASVEIRALMDA